MNDVSDLRWTIIPNSLQLNAEQLLAGPMTITVTDVRAGTDDQPVVVHYDGDGGRPYKPCRTMRKLLIFAWGEDGRQWIGKSMTLYNDPQVKFGGMEVGGIRISHLSDIEAKLKVALTATKGKKALYIVEPLAVAANASAEIGAATDVDTLKKIFGAAWKSASGNEQLQAQYKAAYDARLAALTATNREGETK